MLYFQSIFITFYRALHLSSVSFMFRAKVSPSASFSHSNATYQKTSSLSKFYIRRIIEPCIKFSLFQLRELSCFESYSVYNIGRKRATASMWECIRYSWLFRSYIRAGWRGNVKRQRSIFVSLPPLSKWIYVLHATDGAVKLNSVQRMFN